jgi:hypothetical protein
VQLLYQKSWIGAIVSFKKILIKYGNVLFFVIINNTIIVKSFGYNTVSSIKEYFGPLKVYEQKKIISLSKEFVYLD